MGNLQSRDRPLKVSGVASKLVDVQKPIGSSGIIIALFFSPSAERWCFSTAKSPDYLEKKKKCLELPTRHYVLLHGISHIQFIYLSETTSCLMAWGHDGIELLWIHCKWRQVLNMQQSMGLNLVNVKVKSWNPWLDTMQMIRVIAIHILSKITLWCGHKQI